MGVCGAAQLAARSNRQGKAQGQREDYDLCNRPSNTVLVVWLCRVMQIQLRYKWFYKRENVDDRRPLLPPVVRAPGTRERLRRAPNTTAL